MGTFVSAQSTCSPTEAKDTLISASSSSRVDLNVLISEEIDYVRICTGLSMTKAKEVHLKLTLASGSKVTKVMGFVFGADNKNENKFKITSLELSEGFTEIGYEAFKWLTSLTSITLPSTLKTIKKGAFFGCTNLQDITIPKSVTEIGERAFEKSGLMSATFENKEGWRKGADVSSATPLDILLNGSYAASILKNLEENILTTQTTPPVIKAEPQKTTPPAKKTEPPKKETAPKEN